VDDHQFDDDGRESGSSLREKLSTAHSEIASLAKELVGYKAKDLIVEKGWLHVKPEDLAGVKLGDLETKGAELESSKAALKESVLKEVLEQQGVAGDDLAQAVQALVGKVASGDESTEAAARLRAATQVPGRTPGKLEQEGLFGASRIRAALGA
jgi:hypothetical protein